MLTKLITFSPVFLVLSRFAQAQSQNRKSNTRLKPEMFDLHLELGYFACQVNNSREYLQIFDISKLCDGHADCFMGSDEAEEKNKCTHDCFKDGKPCVNGACIAHECVCNDGWGGCNCDIPGKPFFSLFLSLCLSQQIAFFQFRNSVLQTKTNVTKVRATYLPIVKIPLEVSSVNVATAIAVTVSDAKTLTNVWIRPLQRSVWTMRGAVISRANGNASATTDTRVTVAFCAQM